MAKKDKSYLMEIGRYTSFSFIGEIARYLFLIVASAIVTNAFGAKVYGQYAYVISFLTIIITLSGLGLGSGVMFYGQKFRQAGQESKVKGTIAFAYIAVAAAGGIFTAAVMIFANPISKILLNSPDYGPLLFKMAPLIVIEALYGLSLTVLRSLKRIARYSLIRNIFYHMVRISAILVCFFVFGIKGIDGIVISTYTAYVFVLIYSIFIQYRNTEIGNPTAVSKKEKWEMVKYSLPLFMSSIISILLRQADIIMLGHIKTEEAVAIYKISVQLCAIIPFFKHITATFFGPMISSLYHSGKRNEMIHTYRTVTKWSFTFGLMIFLGIVLFGKSGLHIFGREFIEGHTALILVACGSMIGVMTGQTGSMNAMTGHPKFNLISSIVTFTVNIILNIIMIPKYGIVGAATATLISAIIGNSLSLLYLYSTQKIQPFNYKYIKPLVAGAVSYTVVYLLNHMIMWDGMTDILIKGSIFVLVFTGIILIMKLDEEDKVILNSMHSTIAGLLKRKN